jgi:two-component system phosphate regulon sensor histidine kinase PhoR
MLSSPHFRRLFAPLVVLSLVSWLIVGLWGAVRIREVLAGRTAESLALQARLMADDVLAASTAASQGIARGRLAALAAAGLHATLFAADGKVLGDSHLDPALADSQAGGPEFREALDNGQARIEKHSPALHQNALYVAVRLGSAASPSGVLRLGQGRQELDRAMRGLYVRLGAAAGATFIAVVLAAYFIARSLTRPVLRLTVAASRLAGGDFDQRIDLPDGGELGVLADILNQMATSLGRLVQRVAEDQQELQAVLGSMVEGVIAVDSRQTVRLANESAARMFEFELASARGQRLDQVVRHPRVLELVEVVSRTGELQHARIGPTTAALDLDILICPWKAEPPLRGFVIVANDVAESLRYQQLRSEFVANVSHELRTPLAMIQGFVETLQDGAKDDIAKRDRFLEAIERNARQLSNLIQDLLELSELEERRDPAAWEELDLGGLAARVCDGLRPAAEAKRQRLNVRIAEDLPAVAGRRSDLERAISNLVDNAIKYTDKGGWVSVEVEPGDGQIAVIVEDTGIGIPAEDLPRIFERFFRVDKSRSRHMGGTGLGLSIVKHVVQAHGGSIEVDSKPGHGARFTVLLPAAQRKTSADAKAPAPSG